MTVARETLMAYVDGALPPGEMARVEAEVAADAALLAEVERQRAMLHSLHDAFAPVLEAPVPTRLIAAATRRPKRWYEQLAARLALHPWAASGGLAAAALAAGLVMGLMLRPSPTGDFAASPQGLVARAGLAHALQTRLAANQDAHAATQIGLSFRDGKGALCRTFTASGSAGIACRNGADWRIVALAPTASAQGDYRMAAAALPDAIRDTATAIMVGAPLTRRQEAEAAAAGWR